MIVPVSKPSVEPEGGDDFEPFPSEFHPGIVPSEIASSLSSQQEDTMENADK